MAFRFRRSVKILPGVRINFNKNSTSVTFGGKGFHHTISSTGKSTTSVGIPGTGISYSSSSGGSAPHPAPSRRQVLLYTKQTLKSPTMHAICFFIFGIPLCLLEIINTLGAFSGISTTDGLLTCLLQFAAGGALIVFGFLRYRRRKQLLSDIDAELSALDDRDGDPS